MSDVEPSCVAHGDASRLHRGASVMTAIPQDWDRVRLKRLFRIENGSTPKSGEPSYWGGDITWVTPDDLGKLNGRFIRSSQRTLTTEGLRNCGASLVPTGSLILSTRAPIGHLGIAGVGLATNQGCRSLVPHPGTDEQYFYYALVAARPELKARGTGSTFSELSRDQLGRVSLAVPPPDTQRAIAIFLDRETGKIDTLIEKKRRLLDLLDEKRTALITRAVTRGLDPNVTMKDSGVEWLGEIPAHWETVALRRISHAFCDGPFGTNLKSQHYRQSGVRVIRLQNIDAADFRNDNSVFISEEHERNLGDHSVESGDLLIAGLGDDRNPVGRACVAPDKLGRAIVKADCFRFRLNKKIVDPQFIAHQLSATARAATGALSTGATRSRMNLSTNAARRVALPPLDEQGRIVASIDTKLEETVAVAKRTACAISLLQEYRVALISSAVTGQIDVHETAD